MKMNIKEFLMLNSKKVNITIMNIDDDFITFKCNVCGAIKTVQTKSLYKEIIKNKKIHNLFCSKYFLDLEKSSTNLETSNKFHSIYRIAKERCCNPNNKDYKHYKNKFLFNDFAHFHVTCWDLFLDSLKKYPSEPLSIDRINGQLGYQPNNVRFVPMKENLQNKPNVKPVKMTNIKTNQVIEGKSFGDLAVKFKDISYVSVLHRACKAKRLYKKIWKVEFIEAESTIETKD